MPFEKPALQMREFLTVVRDLVYKGTVDFTGQVFRASGTLRGPEASPFPILIAALGPRMLRIAGELTEGTITWMVGLKTLETHIVPRINAAADAAGRPEPSVCFGVPVAVTDDVAAGYSAAARTFGRYGELPSYRSMLDIEGVESPAEVCIVGNEAEVERQIRNLAGAGATELIASVLPVGDDATASVGRTRALLKGLVGKIP